MQFTRNERPTVPGPRERFTGTVYVDTTTTPTPPSRLSAAGGHFAPGARTAWHAHPIDQTVWVTAGIGRCRREGGPIEASRPGDRVYFEPGENHWHGAAPDRILTHLAMQEIDGAGSSVSWGWHVTDGEYGQQPG